MTVKVRIIRVLSICIIGHIISFGNQKSKFYIKQLFRDHLLETINYKLINYYAC